MDKDLEEFFLTIKFTKNEIEDMKNISPMLDVTTLDEVKKIMKVLEHFGYPKEDIPLLFSLNPNIITLDSSVLADRLNSLLLQNIDVEEFLKTRPFDI